jgi:protein-tyrosine phosphatase
VSEILPVLWIGEFPRAEDVPWLREELGATAVLSLQDGEDLAAKGLRRDDLEAAYRSAEIEFRSHPVADGDGSGLGAALGEMVRSLDELIRGGHRVLVHCNAGYNRSPTVVIAYLCAHRGMTLAEATAFVKARRPCVPFTSVLVERYR